MSENINKTLQEIKEMEELLETMRLGPETLERKIRETSNGLKKRIVSGETTGDEIIDFVLVRYGALNKEVVDFYRELDAKFRASVGQFVLLAHTYKKQFCWRDPGPARSEDYAAVTDYYLGIIKEGGLILKTDDSSCWEIPTEKHIKIKEESVKPGNIPNPQFCYDLCLSLRAKKTYLEPELDFNIELLVGD